MPTRLKKWLRRGDHTDTVVVIAFVAILALLIGFNWPTSAPSQVSSATASPSAETSETEEVTDVYGEGELGPCELEPEILRSRSRELVSRYAQLDPGDRTETLRERIEPFVTDDFFADHSKVIDLSLPAEQAREENGIRIGATPTDTPINVVCSINAPAEAATTVEYEEWTLNKDGSTAGPLILKTASINWVLVEGVWLADNIDV